jgi:hypothetical protein
MFLLAWFDPQMDIALPGPNVIATPKVRQGFIHV